MVNTGFKKVICTAVTIAFVVTSVFSPGNLSAQPIQTSLPLMNIDVNKIIVNSGVAFLEERFTSPEGPKGRTVIAIQNAHGIFDAQENIRALIQELQDQYNFNLVGLEGGAGKSDHTFLRTFPDKEVNRKVAESYMRRAELSGGEAAAILNPKPGIFYGVETPELYYVNRNSFLKAQGLKESNLHAINLFEKKLDKQREKIFPFDLLEFHKAEQKYLNGQMPLWEFINILGGYNLSEQYPGVLAIYAAIAKARQAGRKAEEAKQAEEAAAKVEGRVLFEEIKNLSADIQTKLSAGSKEVSDLAAAYQNLRVLRNLSALEMTRGEYENYTAHQNEFKISGLELNLAPALQFYADAVKRDEAMYQNLLKDMKHENQNISIIVAGGFHTSGFAERLKKDGISFAVYSPRIHDMPKENKYLDVMEGKASYAATIESPLPTMGLNPNGEKFVDSYAAKAIRASGIDPNELEHQWRDSIIRTEKARSILADPTPLLNQLEKIFRQFLTKASQILADLKKKYLDLAGAEAKKKVDAFVESERKKLESAKPVKAASLGSVTVPLLDEIANVYPERWVSSKLLEAIQKKYKSGRVEIVHVAGTTEELSNPSSPSSLEKALRDIPDEKPVLLVLHHYSPQKEELDTNVVIGLAGELKQKDSRNALLRNKVFMNEFDYVFSLRVYPHLPETGKPLAYIDSISIGRGPSDPLRGAGMMSEVFDNIVSILEDQYPEMPIASEALSFYAARWLNRYFSARIVLDEKKEGIDSVVMTQDPEGLKRRLAANANPSDLSDLNYYLNELSKKYGEQADHYFTNLPLLGTIGDRRKEELREEIVGRAEQAFLDSLKKGNLPRLISVEIENKSKTPKRLHINERNWFVQLKRKDSKGVVVPYGTVYFEIPREENSATLVFNYPGKRFVSREISFTDPKADVRIQTEMRRFMEDIGLQIKKDAAGEQLKLFADNEIPLAVTAHSLGETFKFTPKKYLAGTFLVSLIPSISFFAATDFTHSQPILAVMTNLVMFFLNFNIIESIISGFFAYLPAKYLPEMDFKNGIPVSQKTAVFYPILAKSVEELRFFEENVLPSIEKNPDPNVVWVIVSGSEQPVMQEEIAKTKALQERFGSDRIFYLHRNPAIKNWERKRGAYMHFMSWLRSGANPEGNVLADARFPSMPGGKAFDHIEGDISKIGDPANLLIGDSDSTWPEQSVSKLVSKIADPANKEFGIFQGRIRISNRNESFLTWMSDYTYNLFGRQAIAQWNIWGQANFIGHGAGWNIDTFMNRIAGKMAPGYLSHDALGWEDVVVIDDDLGISAGGVARPGFERLLAAICSGKVGAVVSIEASRLARNGRDWHTLLEFCALVGSVIVDEDGVYDPRSINDRLLLGMKGTMSEMELSLLRQRSVEALKLKAARGDLHTTVPIGYVRTEDNRVELDPDLRIREAISSVFTRFAQAGSVRHVLLWFRQEHIELPAVVYDEGRRSVVWRLPTYPSVLKVLTNPIYGGAYVYGRTETRVRIEAGRKHLVRGHRRAREHWQVLIHEHHEGYIDWPTYEHNQRVIADNTNMRGGMARGALRRGATLLAGLLRCAHCGRKLHVAYSGSDGSVGRYHCKGAAINHGSPQKCISFGSLRVDQAVAAEVLKTLSPIGMQAALRAIEQRADDDHAKRRQLELALEQARFEAARAQRQFDAVDPGNRLVAAELERRWNERLAQVSQRQAELEAVDARAGTNLTPQQRDALLALGADLPRVWDHPSASSELRKRILRTVINEIVARVVDARIELVIHWQGGDHTELSVVKNRTGQHRWTTDVEIQALITQLARQLNDGSIASLLNRLGHRTGRDQTWTEMRVRSFRGNHGIAVYRPGEREERGELTLEQAAEALGVSKMTVLRMISAGSLAACQACKGAPWVIKADDLQRPEVRAAITGPGGSPRPADPQQISLELQ